MIKYIAILRGINVGGRKKILMADLKGLFTNKFFENKLKVPASTRNWKTVLKLSELSKSEQIM